MTIMRANVIAATAAVGLSGWAVAVLPVGSAEARSDRQTITVYEKGGFAEELDLGGSGESAGDKVLENLAVFDKATDRRIGQTVTEITLLRPETGLLFVDCEVKMRGGSVVFAGGARAAQVEGRGVTLPVTGGTGRYLGAAGEVHIRKTEHRGADVHVFQFTLVR